MTLMNKKLIWSALAIAMLTTTALAQRHHRPASQQSNAQLQAMPNSISAVDPFVALVA
jgi:hypothetical protein